MRILLGLSCVVLCAASGCATTLSTYQTADVTDFKQVEIEGATGFYANIGPVWGLASEGFTQGKAAWDAYNDGDPETNYEFDEESAQKLFTSAIALAVFMPGQNYQLGLRTGVIPDKMDVGFRWSMNAVRLDTKYQFLHVPFGRADTDQVYRKGSFDMAVGLAGSRYLFDNPALKPLEFLHLDDFSRWDVEVPLYASVDFGQILKLYTSPKYVYSHTTLDENLVNYSQLATLTTGYDLALPEVVHSHFVGSTVGAMVGYRWVWLALELTGGYTFCRPYVFGRYRDLGGPTFYPSAGIIVRAP